MFEWEWNIYLVHLSFVSQRQFFHTNAALVNIVLSMTYPRGE